MAECVTCTQVMVDHQQTYGALQQSEIPEWQKWDKIMRQKWDKIMMDFVTKLPKTTWCNDMIWVIVDRLTRSDHFLATTENEKLEKFANMYVEEIVVYHEVPLPIISNHNSQFSSRFWQKF